jgi:hypothetical protein
VAQPPLSADHLRRHLKPQPASKEPRFEMTFEKPAQLPKPTQLWAIRKSPRFENSVVIAGAIAL